MLPRGEKKNQQNSNLCRQSCERSLLTTLYLLILLTRYAVKASVRHQIYQQTRSRTEITNLLDASPCSFLQVRADRRKMTINGEYIYSA